ncbi:MAG: glycosyltransferase [Elainellaceae cyanobacterium]
MITVTLGTIPFPFARAIDWLECLLNHGTISEDVFVQHGVSDISQLANYPLVKTASVVMPELLDQMIQSSRLVIAHAGQGSARKLAAMDVSFVLLPRLASYGEHIDDHQFAFAHSISELGVTYCSSLESLEQAVLNPPKPLNKPLLDGPWLAHHLIKSYS